MSTTPDEPMLKPARSLGRRLLQLLLALIVLLLVLLGAALYALLGTAGGLRFAAETAPRIAQGTLKFGPVQGRILGGDFELHDIVYSGADGTTVQIARVHLRWHPRALLQLQLRVEKLDVEQLDVQLAVPTHTANDQPARLPTRLPLNLVIDALSLRGFSLQRPQARPFALDVAQFAGSWIGDHLVVTKFNTELPSTGPLSLTAAATMSSDHLQIEALKLIGPGTLEAKGAFGVGTGHSDLALTFHDWRYPLTGKDVPPLAGLKGSANFSGTFKAFKYALQADAFARKQPLRLSVQGSGDTQQLQIAALELHLGAGDKAGSATAHGSVAWAPALRADLDLTLNKLDPGAFVAELNGELNGSLQTHTVMQNQQPQIDFALTLTPSKLRGQPLRLAAHGVTDTRRVHLQDLLLNLGKGTVSASGDVAWLPQLSADLQATLKHIDPAAFAPQWPGALNGQIKATTRMVEGVPDIVFDAQFADSKLRNYPLTLAANGDARGKVVKLSQLSLKSGSTELTASGQVTPPFDAAGKFSSPDLAAIYPGLSGRLDFDFSLQGAVDDPHLLSQGKGSGLRFRENRLASLSWHADMQPSTALKLEVLATDGHAGSVAIPQLKLTADGTESYHHVDFKADTERGTLTLTLQGGFDRKQLEWGGEWQSVKLMPLGLPSWTLEKPVGLLLGTKRFSLEPACFVADSNGGRSCFNLQRAVTGPGLHLAMSLESVALAGFQPLLPKGVELDGRLDGQGELSWVDDNISAAHAELKLSEAHINAPKAPPVELQPSTLSLEQQPDGQLHAVLELKSAQAQINAELAAAQAADFGERALSGHLRIAVPDIAFIQPYVYELSTVGGHIDGDLGFAGTVHAPRLSGKLALSEGHARLVTPGIEVSGVVFSLSGNGDGPLNLQGSMKSGDGTLVLTGTVDPAKIPMRADLSVKGENFVAMSTPNAHVWITPELHLLRDENGAKFDGTLTVPKADITPKDLGNSGVSVSRDQIIITGGQPQVVTTGTPLKIYSNVKLVLGDAVHFSGFGLVTRIEGAVTVVEEPLRDPTAQGELRLIDGAYKAYGQDLTIEDGRLIFDGGAVTQPAVDISASRHPADDIKVGVRVRGTLKKPLLTLQSEPAMSREQQLSWLVLGRALEQNSTQDRSAISSAALSLGLSGGDFIANRLGKSIGLDAISVGSAPAGGSDVAADATAITGSQASQGAGLAANSAAALTLGKFLTPKLFVSYGVSLFQPGQTFRILYTLSHGFKVQAESGVASGGDLLYTYERGKPKKPQGKITTQPASGAAPTMQTKPVLEPEAKPEPASATH
ncbi:MAG: hypothetical protein JWR16_2177 [Nevskia sp.]|nr:hypothetical protein [Nevskia sp.]